MNSVTFSKITRVLTLSVIPLLTAFTFTSCGDDSPTAPKTTNKVLQLDGAGDYLSIPIANHNYVTFTIEVKVKVPDYSQNVHYVSLYQNAYLILGDWSDEVISTWASGLSPIEVGDGNSEGAMTPDEWHHFAFSYDGANQYLLIDGVVQSMVPTTGIVNNDSTSYAQGLVIGARYSGSSQFVAGQIDEVRIWNIFRTETQIRDTMNKTISAQTGLVGYWNFNSGTAEDLSGNDADGTLMGDAVIVKK